MICLIFIGTEGRAYDMAARYGGEEFVLLLPSTTSMGALRLAEEVRAAVRKLALPHPGNLASEGVITISAGVATSAPSLADSPSAMNALIAQADAMLYEAKRTGRNRVVSPATLLPGAAPLPPFDEEARLAAVQAYEARGATRRSAELDRIARLAATLMGTPVGLISVLGRDAQSFAGNHGLTHVDGTARSQSFCAHTILGDDPMVVRDASQDGRFQDNDLVTGAESVRYYAGAPIISPGTGQRLGALCVIDRTARDTPTPAQRALLTDLATMAASLFDEAAAQPPG